MKRDAGTDQPRTRADRRAGPVHQRAVGRLGAGEVEHHGGGQGGAPLGVGGEHAFLPGGGAVLVVVAVAALVEDHPAGGGEEQVGRAPRVRGSRRPSRPRRPCSRRSCRWWRRSRRRPRRPSVSGAFGSRASMARPSPGLIRPRNIGCQPTAWKQGEAAGGVVAAGAVDEVQGVGRGHGVERDDARGPHQHLVAGQDHRVPERLGGDPAG